MNLSVESASSKSPAVVTSKPWFAMLWAMGLVFLTTGYFQNSRPGWNVNSQFALTCAIAERGTLQIDAYHKDPAFETGDKAFFGGHYYSDKSPVTAFIGVPGFLFYRSLARLLGWEFSYAAARYWTTWWTAGLSAALLAGLVTLMLTRRGARAAWAGRAAVLWLVATPQLGYSILLFNYMPACAMALGGFLLVDPVWREGERHGLAMRLLLGGVLLGLASWTLNTMAILALALTVALLVAPIEQPERRGRWGERWRRFWPWALGGLLGASGYFVYTYAIFKSFASPYVYEEDPFFKENMARGLMGATTPRLLVAWLITFHPFQGLFLWFPLALAALGGALRTLWRGARPARLESTLALSTLFLFVLYTSAYFMWWGGWAYAPRHLIPTLPLLALGLGPWIMARKAWVRWLLVGIGALGGILNVAAVALNPQHPPGIPQEYLMQPHLILRWPSPFLQLQLYFWLGGFTDPNWGTALGLSGPASLIPLLGLWLVAWCWLGFYERKKRLRPEEPAGPILPNPSTAARPPEA